MKDDFLAAKPTAPMPAAPQRPTASPAPGQSGAASSPDAKSKTGTTPQAVKAPSPALPKGGGAIRGLGEKFMANPVTGTGSMSVAIATTPGRNGFGPELSLAYDSGAGNGPFGVGWSLSVPAITRKTDKGVPQYGDLSDSDLFILAGAEDLVPKLDYDDGESRWERDVVVSGNLRLERYRPRVEGLFARIERVTETNGSEKNVYWRAITKDNVMSIYGYSPNARVADPEHPERVFSWLLERTADGRGNVIAYEYKAEDLTGVQRGVLHETRRASQQTPITNRYLKRIRYGNTEALSILDAEIDLSSCVFEVVFDYGEHDPDAPTPTDNDDWALRADPFSSYRSSRFAPIGCAGGCSCSIASTSWPRRRLRYWCARRTSPTRKARRCLGLSR